jgi:molecular chaperone GrpE
MASHKDHRQEHDNDAAKSNERAGSGFADVSANMSSEDPSAGSVSPAEQLQKLLTEKQELMNTLVRRQADFENYRKRIEKERQQDRHRGVELLIEHMLPVLDAFDRALVTHADSANAEYRKGFELIQRQLKDLLSKQGLVRMETAGKEFNPHFHHAVERVETSEYSEGAIIDELQPGYLFHDRVLRPAMVRVATAPEERSAQVVRRDD